jgi:transcriptional regulator with XRE-family HTH domain
MKPIDTKWFKGMLAFKKISQRQLAFKMGMDPASMSLMIRGKRPMRMSEAEKMSNVLMVPLEEILFHAGLTAIHTEPPPR